MATTSNAPASTFGTAGSVLFEGKGVDDLLLNISAAYKFVGFTVLEHYGIFDIFRDTDVAAGIENYADHLDKQLLNAQEDGAPAGRE
ncbi:hypothetical protein Ahu01nite_038500 [Winogradskya humida]|uniref:Flavodoxin-like protein n=1 Tax=Winogradskya humida TaxID=113566 RepID=A0ABQ3ZQ92_9ACTN|nr:hypothetical protein Ahu01nite_038500 [Actinoplanes humidus]